MFCLKFKMFITALALNVCTAVSDANEYYNNDRSVYLNVNTAPSTMLMNSQHGIINGSTTILPNTEKYVVLGFPTRLNAITDEGLDEFSADLDRVASNYELHLRRSSVLFGLTEVANESYVNQACYSQLKRTYRGILRKQPWAMKVLDASGTKHSGFVFGQNFWLGSRETCGAVQNPVSITLSKNFQRFMNYAIITEKAPFNMDYRVIYLRHSSPWQVEIKLMSEQIIHVGLCLPSACTSVEIQKLTTHYLERGLFVENDIYDIRPEVLYMKDLKLSENFFKRKSFQILTAVVIFTTIMALCALFLRVNSTSKGNILQNSNSHSTITTCTIQSMHNCVDGNNMVKFDDGFTVRLKSFVKCYDITSNCERLFETRVNSAYEIPIINGLRSICAIWIMIFHVVWYMYFTVNNKTFLISYAEHVFFQYISSAPLLVDVFFTISGFLQTYKFICSAQQMELIRQNNFVQNSKLFFNMLFHRYLRLAPLYLIIMLVVDLFYAYIEDVSVYHINERFDEICSKYWWRNIFFIQNFFNHNDMCLNWTWSLACEMQYFILGSTLLFTYTKHPKFVKFLINGIFIGTIVWTYLIGINIKFQISFDSAFATGTQIYISPFVRILPYVMGAVAAWYILEKKTYLDMTHTKEKCVWNLAIMIFFLCIYSTIKRDMSVLSSTSLFVIGRFLFSLSVCWMIIGSATGRRSWWSRILEARVFQHTNRLTYAFYLLNPLVVAVFFSMTSASTHADPFMLCVLMSGFAIIVYLASIVFSLAFEIPYCNWSTIMLRSTKLKLA